MVLQPLNLPQTDSNSNGLSPLIQSASLSPSLTEDSNISSPTRPVANSGSQSFVSIASNPPSDGLPNGSVLSEDSRNNEVPKKRLGRTSRPLTIMQWNADGIGNKIFELQEYLVNSNVDVLAVQESKLLSTGPKADKDPKIPGYYIQRKDREDAENRGGGLLFYIKNDVRFQPVNKMERFGLETHTIRVQLKRRDWVKITNCYLPSSSTQETRFDPSLLPSGPDSIIVGDLNGHSHIWDSAHKGEADTRGQEIEDWLLD